MLLGHAEGHLLAELVFSGGREEQGFILTGAHGFEVGHLSPHHGVQSVCVWWGEEEEEVGREAGEEVGGKGMREGRREAGTTRSVLDSNNTVT